MLGVIKTPSIILTYFHFIPNELKLKFYLLFERGEGNTKQITCRCLNHGGQISTGDSLTLCQVYFLLSLIYYL